MDERYEKDVEGGTERGRSPSRLERMSAATWRLSLAQ